MRKIIIACLCVFFGLSISAQTPAQKEAVAAQKKQLKFENATAPIVQERFNNSGMLNLHPRQFESQADIDRAKKLIASCDLLMTKAWERIKNQTIKLNLIPV